MAVLAGAIRVSTPFIFVSLGECITERSGQVNLGLARHVGDGRHGRLRLFVPDWFALVGVLAAGLIGVALGALHGFLCGRPQDRMTSRSASV